MDIYSLGLVLYYCLVGRNPWEHLGELAKVLWAILNEQIDPSVLSVSQEPSQVIARATERDPDHRFQTAADMREALISTPEWQAQVNLTITRDAIKPAVPDDPECA